MNVRTDIARPVLAPAADATAAGKDHIVTPLRPMRHFRMSTPIKKETSRRMDCTSHSRAQVRERQDRLGRLRARDRKLTRAQGRGLSRVLLAPRRSMTMMFGASVLKSVLPLSRTRQRLQSNKPLHLRSKDGRRSSRLTQTRARTCKQGPSFFPSRHSCIASANAVQTKARCQGGGMAP